MVFGRARDAVEDACRAEGIAVRAWREVPVDPDALGPTARASAPADRAGAARAAAGRRRRARAVPRAQATRRPRRPLRASLSFRTVVYKALCAADQLAEFYADLRRPDFAVPFGVFHQRFSTNTEPSWERAQPFRLLCHNGEINAIRGNVNWMRARARHDRLELGSPLLDERSSDSGMLDNALELLVRGGRAARARADDAGPAGLAGGRRARAGRACLPSLPRRPDRAVGRPCGRRLLRRPRRRRRARPQRPPAAARRRRGRSTSAAHRRPASSTRRRARPCGAAGSARARRSSSTPTAASRRTLRSSAASPLGSVRGVARRVAPRGLRRRAGAGPAGGADRAARALRLHARGALGRAAADRRAGARADLVDGRRHRAPAARRPRPPALQLLPAALRAGDEPGDRPRPRALHDVARRRPRRARTAARGDARGCGRDRARELLPLPVRARRARGRAARRDLHGRRRPGARVRAARRRGRGGGARGPRDAAGHRRGGGARPAGGADAARDVDRAPPACRVRAAHARDDRGRERRAARGAPLRLPARLRGRGDLPQARAPDRRRARGGRPARRRPPLPGGGAAPLRARDRGRRAQGDVEDGDLRRRGLLRRADLRRARARPRASSRSASPARRARPAGSGSPSSSRRRSRGRRARPATSRGSRTRAT